MNPWWMVAVALWPGWAAAVTLDTDNPDLSLNLDQTLRYTYAQRQSHPDARIAANGAFDQGDALFGPHEAIANRIDWLGEFGLRYRQHLGLRVSVAAWFDAAYGDQGRSNPGAQPNGTPSYSGNRFTPYVQRYYRGPSGEFLDAFAFGSFEWGESVWNVKLGRHAVVWGESLFGSNHAVAYGQTPSDGLKAVANPGASAKETALPIGQLSWVAQIDPELSLLGQYLYEWRPNRLPEGGTYFGVADSVLNGPNVNRLPTVAGRGGDWGLGVKWRPDWLDGTVSAFVRRFDDKAGWVAQATGADTRAVYARGIDLWGLSLAKNVGGVAVGSELSYRRHGPLTSDAASSAAATFEGARGNTWHALLNGALALGPTRFYSLASLAGELTWSGLDRVTQHPQLYRARGVLAACATQAKLKGCVDDSYLGAALSFNMVWLQVWPGVDMEMPLFYSAGLRGNAPSNGGGTEGSVTWRVGLTAKAYARHQFDLAYTGYRQQLLSDPTSLYGSRVLGAPYKDKGWLSFTYQTYF